MAARLRVRAAVLLIQDQQVLMVRHEKGSKTYWLLPGGGVEDGEGLREAAQRELLEETGLVVSVAELLKVVESLAPDRTRHVINFIFAGRVRSGDLQLGEEEGSPQQRLVEVCWKPISELPQLVIHPPIGDIIADMACNPQNGVDPFIDGVWVD